MVNHRISRANCRPRANAIGKLLIFRETKEITKKLKNQKCSNMNPEKKMANRVNGSSTSVPRKHLLVTITPYLEQENKRVTNGTSGGPPPPPLPAPVESPTAKSPAAEDAVEMQSIESFKLKESPSPSTIPPKPPSTYFSVSNSGANSPTLSNGGSPSRHSLSPAKNLLQSNGLPNHSVNDNNNNNNNNNLARITTSDQQKPSAPIGKVAPVVPMSTFGAGKIAVRIGAYEGETKQPSRLDFLPPAQTPPGAPELPAAKIIPEQVVDGPVVSRLQNELAATLQRSNLRKKTEVENNAAGFKQIAECPTVPIRHSSTELENGATAVSLLQSNVEKLAAALSNRVTIKVSPENGSR